MREQVLSTPGRADTILGPELPWEGAVCGLSLSLGSVAAQSQQDGLTSNLPELGDAQGQDQTSRLIPHFPRENGTDMARRPQRAPEWHIRRARQRQSEAARGSLDSV